MTKFLQAQRSLNFEPTDRRYRVLCDDGAMIFPQDGPNKSTSHDKAKNNHPVSLDERMSEDKFKLEGSHNLSREKSKNHWLTSESAQEYKSKDKVCDDQPSDLSTERDYKQSPKAQEIIVKPDAWKKWIMKTAVDKDTIMAVLYELAKVGRESIDGVELNIAISVYQTAEIERINDEMYYEYCGLPIEKRPIFN